ncbi:sialate O-acetylesterase [Thiofilum flexile]|uniref:sialate O-acetylesterase n=1 Tax=Thiofilum flexile TaxID=125627 RepID=UPI000381C908|nr:sialate O-acetylesterase [Thiofilum flexile]
MPIQYTTTLPTTQTTLGSQTSTATPAASASTWNLNQNQIFSQNQQQMLLNLILQLLIQLAQQSNNQNQLTNNTGTTTPAPSTTTPATNTPTQQNTATPNNNQKVIDVFLLGGQSNAAALGAKRLENALEKSLGADTATHQTNVFSYAVGSTNLYSQWKADGTADPKKDGGMYQNFQRQLDTYMAKLHKDNPDAQINIKGMFWHQGESDALANRGTAKYEEDLTRFIQDVRVTTGVENLPFMVGRLTDIRNWAPIRQAQDQVGAKDPNAVSVNLDALKPMANGVHFTPKGYDTMAQLFADAYKAGFST